MNAMHNHSMNDLNQMINQKIAILAYQKAESRGLQEQGHETEDWLEAEQEVIYWLREA